MVRSFLFFIVLIFIGACTDPNSSEKRKNQLSFKEIIVKYPPTYKDTTLVDDYFGLEVADPYRWLEEDRSPATQDWVDQQRSLTDNYLDQIPYRNAIHQRLKDLWDYERYRDLQKNGDHYYFFRNTGLQNQDVLYKVDDVDDEKYELILDPNKLSPDGTASLGEYSFSDDGRYLAYQVSESGSDWNNIYVKDLEGGRLLSDTVRWVKFSNISWHNKGFFYSRYPSPEGSALSGKNEFHQLYYHKLGQPQSKDELVFADRLHPQRNVYAKITSDERFLILSLVESTSGNALYFKEIDSDNIDFIPIVDSFQYDFVPVDNIGNSLLVLTNYKAPNWRLIRISTTKWDEEYWEELIPESEDVLEYAQLAGGKILAQYIHNASSQIRIFDMQGTLEKELILPYEHVSVTGIESSREEEEVFLTLTTFTRPQTIFQLNMGDYKMKVVKEPTIDFPADRYDTRQVWYESYDGTKIPIFIIHKKGLELDGKRPTMLYGYGGFNIPVLPVFNRTRINLFPVILENDGVCAVANIRGGGEFGTKWHQAGTQKEKQNVFDDFQAAAEYLIANQYCNKDKLAIYGRSNGGLLVGACMTQRPDLYRVALPAVGVLDMLRFHRFTIGWAWTSDYGSSKNPSDFDYLYSYSPLHNVEETKYPATLITTANHDDRVVPAHSFKFAAELQSKQQGELPVLIRIDSSAGHGAGKPVTKSIAEGADVLAFTLYNMQEDVIYNYGK